MDTTGSLALQGNNSIEREHGGRRSYDDAVEGLNPFRGEKATNAEGEDDDEALLRAALEKLPTGLRAQTAVVGKEHKPLFDPTREALVKEGGQFFTVDVKHLTAAQREHVVNKALQTSDQDNERFLQKWRERMDRVDLELPKVEVAYRNLTVEANVYVGSRALPTLINSVRNIFEDLLSTLRLKRTNKRKLTILNNISGVLKPGRLTLLLGPPSSGKSTLLLALAGKATSDLKLTGEILYNGHHFDEFVAKRTAAYVPQNDKHIGELTVRETLDFAAQCQGVGDKEEMLQELSRREVRKRILPDPDIDAYMKAAAISGRQHSVVTEYIQKILGLDICADTIVGNEMLRGISGGQRKRVTTGEMIVGAKKVLFMDEISTGLDSATTYQIVRCIRNFVHLQDATVLVSLLQPAPEAFEQFDDVILLSEGSLVYHGPRGRILEFFEMLGFRCPERKGIADFLQEVTSLKDQRQYWARGTPYKFVPVNAFAEAFQKWDLGRELTAAAAAPYDKAGGHKSALVRTQYALRSWNMFKATMKREWTLMVRNRFLYIFRTFQVFYVSLITSTLFFRTTLAPNSVNDGNLYLGVLFFSLIFMMFNGFSEMSIMIARLPVFYKQRDNNFFPGWAFNLPIAILRVPYSVVEAIVWSCVVYWVVGLAPEAGRFFTFMLIMFLMHNLSVSLFRLIGAVSRSMVLANTFGAFIILLVFLLGGFIIDKRDIEPWWVWAYWIVPLSYAQNAVAVNEYTAPRWNKPYQYNYVHGTNATLGQTVLQSRAIHEDNWWIWLGVGVMAAYVILFNVGVSLALAYLPPVGRPQAVLGEEELRNKEKARQGIDHKGDVEMTSSIAPAGGEAAGASGADVERGSRELHQAPSMSPVDEEGADVITNGADVRSNGADLGANSANGANVSTDGADVSTSGTANGVVAGSGIRGGAARIGRKIDLSNSTIQKFQNAGAAIPTTGMILPFEPMAMTFHNVNYYVDMPKNVLDEHGKPRGGRLQLLRNVSGAFRPGVLTALIGVTGAGKTTLLDVLAGRKTGGYIEGELRVGGHPKEQATFARIAGYVEQFDIHSPQTTVHEALQFSAALRLPADIDPSMRQQFVEQVMDLVELAPLRNALVGLPGISGLSVEQRKRLTIAVELVANPSIIFMDEPTSGLDARAAAIVMRAVRNVVDTGRTVVCTIHQPSIDIFEAFDELLLMKRGGQVVYAGPLGDHSLRLIEYFQAIEGVPKIKDRYNPATWMLEITTPGAEQRLGRDFADIYHSSALFKQQEALIAELEKPPAGTSPLAFDTVYARSFFDQFRVCFWKNNWTYWRSPQYNTVRFFFTVVVALLFGTIFWNKGTKRGSQQDIFNVMGALYATVLFLGFNNASTVQPVVAVERSVFYREKAAGLYHPLPFAAAQGLVELPYLLVQAAVYSVITYSMIQFEWQAGKFFWFLLFMWLTQCFFTFYGIMAVAITPSQQLAAVISSAFYSIWNLFSGFLIPRPQIPGWWIWYYYLNPMAWTLYGLISSQLGDVSEEFTQEDGTRITVSAYIKQHFGYHHNLLGLCVGAMVCFVVLFWAVSATAYWRINFQKR